nr:hypothetical protein [Actinomadura madurae]
MNSTRCAFFESKSIPTSRIVASSPKPAPHMPASPIIVPTT